MLISHRWINELFTEGGLPEISAERLELALTEVGLEVEGVSRHDLKGVVVGEVRSVTPHPKADRLNVAEVFDGESLSQVVCGASNLPDPAKAKNGESTKVAYAKPGSELPGGFRIEARELRGVPSAGMLASEQELGLGSDDSGLLILEADAKVGTLLTDHLPLIQDTVFEISVTPNRPDALGHWGVARDIAVRLGLSLPERSSDWPPKPEVTGADFENAVTIEETQSCGRYIALGLQQVEVGESPLWLRVRLHRVGLRSINNVVDVTNYVLMENGQPMHAFDRDKLSGERVIVRAAEAGEKFKTLDDQELELDSTDLVIADTEKAQALAGVMGGAESGVNPGCQRVFLEFAWFDPPGIRKSARKHQLHTDSSHRFERGVDDGIGLQRSARRALELIQKLCGAKLNGVIDKDGQRPPTRRAVLRYAKIKELLGIEIPRDKCSKILNGLGIAAETRESKEGLQWDCTLPSFRPDLCREVDLIEELLRHHGLENLNATANDGARSTEEKSVSKGEQGYEQSSKIRLITDGLCSEGFHEIVSLVFADPDRMKQVDGELQDLSFVRLKNPMRSQNSVLRTDLLPGMLDVASNNISKHGRTLRLFEVGRVYRWAKEQSQSQTTNGPTSKVDAKLPAETNCAAILLRQKGSAEEVVGQLVGVVQRLLQRGGYSVDCSGNARLIPELHPGVQLALEVGDKAVAWIGELHPDLQQSWGFGSKSDDCCFAYAKINLEYLPEQTVCTFGELPRFPATDRDLSMEASVGTSVARIIHELRRTTDEFLASKQNSGGITLGAGDDEMRRPIVLLDDYRGQGVEEGKKALLFRFYYRAADRSVTDDEVQVIHGQVVERALERMKGFDSGVRLR